MSCLFATTWPKPQANNEGVFAASGGDGAEDNGEAVVVAGGGDGGGEGGGVGDGVGVGVVDGLGGGVGDEGVGEGIGGEGVGGGVGDGCGEGLGDSVGDGPFGDGASGLTVDVTAGVGLTVDVTGVGVGAGLTVVVTGRVGEVLVVTGDVTGDVTGGVGEAWDVVTLEFVVVMDEFGLEVLGARKVVVDNGDEVVMLDGGVATPMLVDLTMAAAVVERDGVEVDVVVVVEGIMCRPM